MRRLIQLQAAMSLAKQRGREFAPLRPGASSDAPKLQGVVFDVDGTLCEPQTYMFGEMRAVLGISKGTDILDHIYALPTPEQQETAMESIRQIERTAMATQVAQPGLVELMGYLDERGVRKGICTRNFDAPVRHLLTTFLAGSEFGPIVTRDFRPPKPHPAGILHIARSWGLHQLPPSPPLPGANSVEAAAVTTQSPEVMSREGGAEEEEMIGDASALIMVGDSIDDMTAGRRAGAATVLLANNVNVHLAEHEHTDLVISRLDELIGVLEDGFKGREIERTESDGAA